jgi:hypothetical protein
MLHAHQHRVIDGDQHVAALDALRQRRLEPRGRQDEALHHGGAPVVVRLERAGQRPRRHLQPHVALDAVLRHRQDIAPY